MFGVLERGGKVYTQIVANCSKATLQAVLLGKVTLGSTVHSDGWHGYDGLVDVGFAKHYCIRHDQNHFAHNSLPPTRSGGIHQASFAAFLKETEFRFNHRHHDLYRLLLKSLRHQPLGR